MALVLDGGRSWCAARVPRLPVWGSGGLRQLGMRLQLSLCRGFVDEIGGEGGVGGGGGGGQ